MKKIEEEDTREKMVAKTRENFAELATADENEVMRISSAVNMGLTVMGMMDTAEEARKLIPKGMEDEGSIVTETMVTLNSSGGHFRIIVVSATDEDIAKHEEILSGATDFDETMATKH